MSAIAWGVGKNFEGESQRWVPRRCGGGWGVGVWGRSGRERDSFGLAATDATASACGLGGGRLDRSVVGTVVGADSGGRTILGRPGPGRKWGKFPNSDGEKAA